MEGLFPSWSWVIGLWIGAAIGSFLNVVIYRMPLGLSLGDPKHSFCPSCRHRLTIPDLIPLLSWLFLGGKCRHCRARVPGRYFMVELITGSLFAVFWYQHLIFGWDPAKAVFFSLFAAALIAAIYIDLKHFIIPDQVNAAMLIFGLGLNAVQFLRHKPDALIGGWPSSIVGALTGIAVLWGIALLGRLIFRKDAMGHGDIKMARGMGAVLLPTAALMSFGVAVTLGAVGGIAQILAYRKQVTPDEASEDDEPYEPESIASLLKCGLGYVLCIDVLGLFFPKLYESWFGENPFAIESVEEDDFVAGPTMIPFGPYLAVGALAVAIFEPKFRQLIDAYIAFVTKT